MDLLARDRTRKTSGSRIRRTAPRRETPTHGKRRRRSKRPSHPAPLHKLRGFQRQGSRQPAYVDQGGVPAHPLDARHEGRVQPGSKRELFLREPQLPASPQAPTERGCWGCASPMTSPRSSPRARSYTVPRRSRGSPTAWSGPTTGCVPGPRRKEYLRGGLEFPDRDVRKHDAGAAIGASEATKDGRHRLRTGYEEPCT